MPRSYASGVATKPLIGETIGENLEHTVARFGDREALFVRHQSVRLTYAELDEHVNALARGLLAAGLRKGDRLGIWAPNCAEWVLTQYASAKAGIILVNVNPAYRTTELGAQISASIVGAHLGASGLPTESGFVAAFVISAAALGLAFAAALLIPRRAREPVVPHGYERLGGPARAGAR
jgi:fatty-acyl-CoA synthase